MAYAGLFGELGLVWSVAGFYFLTVGAAALVITMSHTLDGRLGAALRRRGVGGVLLVLVLGMLGLTVLVALVSRVVPSL